MPSIEEDSKDPKLQEEYKAYLGNLRTELEFLSKPSDKDLRTSPIAFQCTLERINEIGNILSNYKLFYYFWLAMRGRKRTV